jgi:hypothetical protein
MISFGLCNKYIDRMRSSLKPITQQNYYDIYLGIDYINDVILKELVGVRVLFDRSVTYGAKGL